MSSLEGGLDCPIWVGGPPGPSSGHHPKVSLPEPLPRATLADPQQRIATNLPFSIILASVLSCPRPVWRAGRGLWAGS